MEKQNCFYLVLGTIFKLHGYKGEVNIYIESDIDINPTKIDFLYIEENTELIPFYLESIRNKKKNILLVKFEDIDSEKEAKKIIKSKVYIKREDILEAKEKKINQNELIIGFDVIDKKLGNIGNVKFVNTSTSQDLIIVSKESKEFFIPFHENFIVNINTEKKYIEVSVTKELLDIN